jgi:tetratricopeptide (TPR) repeat protein
VGKSALLRAAAAQIVASGLPCRRFAAPASPRPLALAEAMAELYRRWQPGLPEPAAAAAGRLAKWPQALRAAESREAQINAHAHALADLRIVCEAAPHALILDDAHRLDHGSRDLLDFVAFFVRESRIVLLVGGRSGAHAAGDPGSEDEDPILRALTSARQAGSGVRIVQMRELGRDDVVGLVHRRFGSSHEFELLGERLFDLTQGHPFFVSEALQHLVLTEQLRREKGGWQLAPNTERKLLPRMADTILSEHITAVPAEDREVIELLALFPSGTEAATLGRVLGVGPEARARDAGAALERGVRVGLLQSDGDPARYRFVHELLREASAARCPETTARRYHRQIADVLADTPTEAYHRLAAGETSERSRACFLREAQGYEARRAPWEALRYYEAALAADPQAADADDLTLRVAEVRIQVGLAEPAATMLLQRLVGASQPLARARLLHRLGGAYGRMGRNDEALVHLQAASELMAQHAGAEENQRFTADLVRVQLARGDYAGAVTQCTNALAGMPEDAPPASRAALLLLQGEAERQSGDHATAEPTCRAALEVLKPLGRTIELAQAYTQIGLNYYYRRVFDQAERFHLAALKVHTELGDLNGMKSAYNNLGMAQMRMGKLEEAIRSFEESLDIKRRLGDLPGEGSSLNNLGNLWEKRGDNLRALNCYRRGIRIYRHLNRPRELATLYNNMSEVLFRLGRFRNALRYLERAQQHAASLGGAYIAQVVALNRGATLIAIHDPHGAAAALNAAAGQVRRSRTPGLGVQLHALLCLAHAHADHANEAAVQERLALEAMSPELEPDAQLEALLSLAEAADVLRHAGAAEERARQAERLAAAAERPHGRVRALRLLAAASAERGDWDVAEKLLGEAESLCQSFGFRYELAKCYKCLGKLHWEIGLRSRAEDDFQRCIDLLGDLGLTTELGLTYLELARLAPGPGAGDG